MTTDEEYMSSLSTVTSQELPGSGSDVMSTNVTSPLDPVIAR